MTARLHRAAALALALPLAALAAPGWRLDRVELLADETGRWLDEELPLAPWRPGVAAARLAEQLTLTAATPAADLRLGLALAHQSASWEPALGGGWSAVAGVQGRLLLPAGVFGGLAWTRGPVRLGLGLALASEASWARPRWDGWALRPTVSAAWVRRPRPGSG